MFIYNILTEHTNVNTRCNFVYFCLFCFQSGNKREAEHLVKNIIKIVIKIGILYRNNQFNDDELSVADRFRVKFQVRCKQLRIFHANAELIHLIITFFIIFLIQQTTQMAIISFHEVDYSFDLPYLQKALTESHAALKSITQRHLTDKSLNRIDEIFQFFNDPKLLETSFRQDSPYREIVAAIVSDLNKAIDVGDI